MNLTQYDPGNVWNRLQDDLNNFFKSPGPWLRSWPADEGSSIATAQWVPAVNIEEKSDKFLISADIPGVKPEDVEVSMENGILSIRGERKSEERKEEKGFRRIECSYGAFHRRFALPETADAENVQAKANNGVLEITIGKREASKPKAIKVEH
jgi:HSP20 family protein